MPTYENIRSDAAAVSAKMVNEWGAFRRFIAKNPLTGFWTGAAVGAAFATILTLGL